MESYSATFNSLDTITGCDSYTSIDDRKDQKEMTCTLCLKDGVHEPAISLCKDCNHYFCKTCKRYHDGFRLTRNHVQEDIQPSSDTTVRKRQNSEYHANFSETGDVSRLRKCEKHPRSTINLFCENHNQACCGECAFSSHRSLLEFKTCLSNFYHRETATQLELLYDFRECRSVIENLLQEAKGITESSKYQQNLEQMADHLTHLRNIKKKHMDDSLIAKADKMIAKDSINQYFNALQERLDNMRKTTIGNLEECYTNTQQQISGMVKQVDQSILNVDKYLEELEQQKDNDVECYIKYREGKEIVMALDSIVQSSALILKRRAIQFKQDDKIENEIKKFAVLGKIELEGDSEDFDEVKYLQWKHRYLNMNKVL